MASEYANVLNGMNIDFSIIGRSKGRCDTLKEKFPTVNIYSGGLEKFKELNIYDFAIIASNIDYLLEHAQIVLKSGIKNILIEKPGGKNLVEIEELFNNSSQAKANVFIAYNRRFFCSVQKFLDLIGSDSKILSFNFEFTEWPHTFEGLENNEIVKENLLYANSTHLIDLAFFLNGAPQKLISFSSDKLDWHKKAIYTGIGTTTNNVVFSYQANWKGPGRWGLEMITETTRYYFKPLEELWVQKQRSVKLEKIEIDDYIDKKYKPGLYKQVESFLFNQQDHRLINIHSHYENCKNIYEVILNGNIWQ